MKSDNEKVFYASLGEYADVIDPHPSHRAPEEVADGYPFLGIGDIDYFGTAAFDKVRHVDVSVIEDHEKSYIIDDKTIGYAKMGNTIGKIVSFPDRSKHRYAISPALSIINPKPNINPWYLRAVVESYEFWGHVNGKITGSTRPSIGIQQLRNVPIPIFPNEIQNIIGEIWKVIYDKISLNMKINENLELQAQAIFIDLFITNAKPEWKMGTISDLGNVVGGGTPSKKVEEYYTNDGIAWITPKDLSNDKSKFITHGETDITDLGLAKSSATLMPRGSVLFSSRAPIGYIAIADGQVSTNQGFKSIVPFDNVGTAYVYYFLKENLSAIENVASGSTFKEVSGGTMKNFPAVIPDDDTLAKFKQFCSPLLEQQRALEYENRYLASLRDTLLPKLMNGEIDVSEIKI